MVGVEYAPITFTELMASWGVVSWRAWLKAA
jgi:hypothetical protein